MNIKRSLIFTIVCLLLVSFMSCSLKKTHVAYKHEILYEEYKKANPITGTPLPEAEINKETLIFENERFSFTYLVTLEMNVFPHYVIYDNVNEKSYVLSFKDIFTVYDSEGQKVTSLFSGSPNHGYYNPITEKHEPYTWITICDDNTIELKILVMEMYLISEKQFPKFLTFEDYNEINTEISNNKNFDSAVTYYFRYYSPFKLTKSNLDNSYINADCIREEFLDTTVYKLTSPAVGTYGNLDTLFEYLNFSVDKCRQLESKIFDPEHEAYMAMVTLTIDLSGEYPTIESDYEMISPKNHNVANIYFGGKDFDWNEYFKENYQR